ncbi:hypothetical protein A3K73_07330 [Candidatus Pacearchaeota archaeon RBG_13_36_9]|nr:MAG: hypothetical protein A3K73_07330 [Candidatus Pacearchaeota archaeon RBG_13_36_9]
MDTTLRDGEQNPLCTMYPSEKLKIAKILEEMRVDVIETGFAASHGDDEVMREIAHRTKGPYLCGLARAVKEDIDKTFEAYRDYDRKMVHIFVPTSKVQVDAKMKKSEDELIEMAASAVRYARKYFPVVEFTAEDSVRSEFGLLEKIYGVVLNEGARVINVADTVGCASPKEFGELVYKVNKFVKGIKKDVQVSVHCHNDLGMATANTLSAIENGAEQVECTICGIGERSGNCAIEQIVAWSLYKEEFGTNIDSSKLYEAAKLVERATKFRNNMAPIVGESAFSHKSGIHQHGVINNRNAYEVIDPALFGRKSEIIIGPHSGYHGLVQKAEELGYKIDKEQAAYVIDCISGLVRNEIKKNFSDRDIIGFIKRIVRRALSPL